MEIVQITRCHWEGRVGGRRSRVVIVVIAIMLLMVMWLLLMFMMDAASQVWSTRCISWQARRRARRYKVFRRVWFIIIVHIKLIPITFIVVIIINRSLLPGTTFTFTGFCSSFCFLFTLSPSFANLLEFYYEKKGQISQETLDVSRDCRISTLTCWQTLRTMFLHANMSVQVI